MTGAPRPFAAVPAGHDHEHGHSHMSPREWLATAMGASLALVVVLGLVAALLVWAHLVRRRGAQRRPCPGCGLFFDPATDRACPACGRPLPPEEDRHAGSR